LIVNLDAVTFKRHKLQTMKSPDIRWIQRFSNYKKALLTLSEAADLAATRALSNLEQQGLIQGFEFTHELAWNVLKDYLEEQGFVGIIGSRNATREAFKNALIADGEVWMDMIKARNMTSHTYSNEIAQGIATDILQRFYPAFEEMAATFSALMTRGSEGNGPVSGSV
jgi:nucleotidyltransferase substrate binding protein (TIGR01987 family)